MPDQIVIRMVDHIRPLRNQKIHAYSVRGIHDEKEHERNGHGLEDHLQFAGTLPKAMPCDSATPRMLVTKRSRARMTTTIHG